LLPLTAIIQRFFAIFCWHRFSVDSYLQRDR
jgi:hypothetical protein